MKWVIISIGFLLFSQSELYAQPGLVRIIQPEEVQNLIYRHASFLDRLETIDGFRIQIYATTDLQEAENAKALFDSRFVEIKSHIIFDAPFYKVRVGDFVNRSECYYWLRDIQRA